MEHGKRNRNVDNVEAYHKACTCKVDAQIFQHGDWVTQQYGSIKITCRECWKFFLDYRYMCTLNFKPLTAYTLD